MQITDEMVSEACFAYQTKGNMRAALEAALGKFMLQYGDNVELQESEQIGFKRSAACIEDLAEALSRFAAIGVEFPADIPETYVRDFRNARATLERWGLK